MLTNLTNANSSASFDAFLSRLTTYVVERYIFEWNGEWMPRVLTTSIHFAAQASGCGWHANAARGQTGF
jgi:hypothetical protein